MDLFNGPFNRAPLLRLGLYLRCVEFNEVKYGFFSRMNNLSNQLQYFLVSEKVGLYRVPTLFWKKNSKIFSRLSHEKKNLSKDLGLRSISTARLKA